jgi:hypothetical protein
VTPTYDFALTSGPSDLVEDPGALGNYGEFTQAAPAVLLVEAPAVNPSIPR